jgi:septum site-determining protein MinD
MVKSGQMMSSEDVREILAAEILGIIPEDEEVVDTTNRGEPIVLDSTRRLASIFGKIARRLDGETVAFTPLEAPGFFDKLFTAWKAG